jgi:hypothetical protein
MADPKWPSVQGRVAHIRGDRLGSARYDPSMTDEQRRAFENLILVCPNDHALIDDLERDAHPPALLEQMKQEHEQRTMESDAYQWCSESELTKYANMLLVAQFGQVVSEEPQDHEQARGPG